MKLILMVFLLLPFCGEKELNIFSNIKDSHHDIHVTRNTEGCMGCHFNKPSLSISKSNTNSALYLAYHKK